VLVTGGIFVLAGVIVGGLLSVVVEWFKLDRDRRRRGRVAARMVFQELVQNATAMRIVKTGDTHDQITSIARATVLGGTVDDAMWTRYAPDLADIMDGNHWDTVANAYFYTARFQATARINTDDAEAIAKTLRQHMRDNEFLAAGAVLNDYAELPHFDGLAPTVVDL
jgi:hypothetical protein